jgi:UDP-N-acetylglucosamine 2-epimerase (non-hydrolysing)
MRELSALSHQMPVVFPMHPRTKKMLSEFKVPMSSSNGLKVIDPIGYHDSLNLTKNARLVLTDSGGLQEESTYFRTPCLTLRPNTERPITITLGSNKLTSISKLRSDIEQALSSSKRIGTVPPLWDGQTAKRTVQEIITASNS